MSLLSILFLILVIIAIVIGAVKQEFRNSTYWFFIAFAVIGFSIVGLPFLGATGKL